MQEAMTVTIRDNYKETSLHGLIVAMLLALCSVGTAFAENSTPTEVIEGAIERN